MLGDVSSLFDLKSTAVAESQILASRLVVTLAVEQFLRLPIFFGEFETEQDICKPYQSSPDNDIARRRIIGSGQIAAQLGRFNGITCKGFGG